MLLFSIEYVYYYPTARPAVVVWTLPGLSSYSGGFIRAGVSFRLSPAEQ